MNSDVKRAAESLLEVVDTIEVEMIKIRTQAAILRGMVDADVLGEQAEGKKTEGKKKK